MSGVYTWKYSGSSFPVLLRPSSVFYCDQFPTKDATWTSEEHGRKLLVDWKKFGKYEFIKASNEGDSAVIYDGHAVGKPESWRKLELVREFSPAEKTLLGSEGHGSAWEFIWEKGSFEVQFFCDGFNHFVCPKFPAHSHWISLDESNIEINWGQYGKA